MSSSANVKLRYEKCLGIWGNASDRGQTVEEWVAEQKNKNADISFRFIDGASHAIFNGRDINSLVRATPSGIKLNWTTGAKPGVADKLFDELLTVIRLDKR